MLLLGEALDRLLQNPQDDVALEACGFWGEMFSISREGPSYVLSDLLPYLVCGCFKAVAYAQDDAFEKVVMEVTWDKSVAQLNLWIDEGYILAGSMEIPMLLATRYWVFRLEKV